MGKLHEPCGMDSGAVGDVERRVRRAVRTSIWGTSIGGRGRRLEGLLWTGDATRGQSPKLPDAEDAVRWTRRWVDHLIDEGVRTKSELEGHIGGWVPERDVLYPPKIKPFKRAFAAIADRLGKLRKVEGRLSIAEERRASAIRTGKDRQAEDAFRRAKTAVDAAKKGLHAECAVFDAIGAARDCTPDASRKALKKSEKSQDGGKRWERFVDYRQIVTATPQRPGTRRLFLDIEELERRHPGAWERLTRRD